MIHLGGYNGGKLLNPNTSNSRISVLLYLKHKFITGMCYPCTKGVCEKKYDYRHNCDEPDDCTCHESAAKSILKGVGSFALGVGAFAGDVVLTGTTGGLGAVGIAAVVGGNALTGAGATAAIQPMTKKIHTIVGAATGLIGLGGASGTSFIASKVRA